MKTTKKIIFLTLGLLCAVSDSSISAESQREMLEAWRIQLKESTLSSVLGLMSDAKGLKWPMIHSPTYYAQLGSDVADKGAPAGRELKLLFLLRNRVLEDVRDRAVQGGTCLELAHELERSGGYGNALLADGIRRCGIFLIACQMLETSKADGKQGLSELAASFGRYAEDFKTDTIADQWEELSRKDSSLEYSASDIGHLGLSSDGGMNILGKLSAMGVPRPEAYLTMNFEAALDASALPALFVRRNVTTSLWEFNLRGLIRFLENGGTRSDLDPSNVDKFRVRMGKWQSNFKSRAWSRAGLFPSDLIIFYDICKAGKESSSNKITFPLQ